MSYGVPYKGSKNMLAEKIAEALPSEGFSVFVDLFAGGCAITHAMMLKGGFARYLCNDIDGGGVRLFVDAIQGKYHDETRWISREDFFRLKGTDPYVRFCWSFGNNDRDYLYSKEIEPYKRACHELVMFRDGRLFAQLCPEVAEAVFERLDDIEDTKTRRVELGRAVVSWLKAHGTGELFNGNPLYRSCRVRKPNKTRPVGTITDCRLQSLQRLERLESLQSLERLERLQRLERLESLQSLLVSYESYDAVAIPHGALVYCDPPYKGTNAYTVRGEKQQFDHAAFYDWCGRQEALTVISEYDMPADRFACVKEFPHRSRLSSTANNGVTERLFVPRHQEELWREATRGKKPRWARQSLFDF